MTHKWNTDFASDNPEHARRQGFAPATGPDPKQPDMVLRAELERTRADNERLREGLVLIYREAPAAVADACDCYIDRSGELLGWIRERCRPPPPETSDG